MAISQPVPPQKRKKSDMGCLGCGCLFIVIIFLGVLGFFGFATYLLFKNAYTVTSAEAEQIPAYTVTDDTFTGAQKKIASFQQDVAAGKASTLTLSADELNALIHHQFNFDKYQSQLMVSFDGATAHVLGTVPTNSIPVVSLGIKDRYFNVDALTGISFNSETKEIEFEFHKFQVGETSLPESQLASLQNSFSQGFNQRLKANPDIEKILQAATNVSIQNGQFVIETKGTQ
jgi:hypothetical protein